MISYQNGKRRVFGSLELEAEFTPEELLLVERFKRLLDAHPEFGLNFDVHNHTDKSDGEGDWEAIARRAAMAGIQALGVTDHNVFGFDPRNQEDYRRAMRVEREYGVWICPGVEIDGVDDLSSWGGDKNTEVHVGALFLDSGNARVKKMLSDQKARHEERNHLFINKIRSAGYRVPPLEKLASEYPNVTMRHIAQHTEYSDGQPVESRRFFNTHMQKGGDCYVPKEMAPVREVIETVAQAGAIPILNHPWTTYGPKLCGRGFESIALRYVDWGLRGVEGFSRKIPPEMSWRIWDFAGENELSVFGGSDSHSKEDLPIYAKNVLKIMRYRGIEF